MPLLRSTTTACPSIQWGTLITLLLLSTACQRHSEIEAGKPPSGICKTPSPNTACGVPTFSPKIRGPGAQVLTGASGLAILDGSLYTVLEASGVGAGIAPVPPNKQADLGGALGLVRGVLFRAEANRPNMWTPLDIALSPSCHKLITTLAGDHRRNDLELESIDVRRGPAGGVRVAVGSDFGYVATGELKGSVVILKRCAASQRELPNNKAFEAVTLPRSATGSLMAFEERPRRVEAAAADSQRYRRQWLNGSAPNAARRSTVLRAPKRPRICKKMPRVAGSASVGDGTVLIMSCKHVDGGYRYFLGATAPSRGDVLITALSNNQYGELTPNLEGLASAGGCNDPLWIISDDHNSGGAPTVLATTAVPLAFKIRLGCGE